MPLNQFRQDPISGKWVLFVTSRAPGHLGQKITSIYKPISECPFENIEKASGDKPLSVFSQGMKIDWTPDCAWSTAVVRNKFPGVSYGNCLPIDNSDFWPTADATGYHELVITNEHDKFIPDFSDEQMFELMTAYQERFVVIDNDACGDYVLIFHNHGPAAGASVYHNHSQILSLPFVPPGILTSIENNDRYFKEKGMSGFDVMLEKEITDGKRIIFENDSFVLFCPYTSRSPYEMRIYSKNRNSQFGSLGNDELTLLGQILRQSLKKMKMALNDPDYNFYIHPAPRHDNGQLISEHYRWHIEIVPRLSAIASVELGTNVFVNVVDPDEAAKNLKNV
ncbi:MAG: Galactose-1-phosphate uridylyltransferase [Candidatus Yanofskybacteria bacterium GW2011_GWA1_44_21]|uniref:Galactose-1-phosphate uridyl transferase N-terminal domain-containing protein n=2 Tax=Candidatus Yanofskyibacteriota TaxID=1752733 RepID=A0A1F8H0E0_9BACT|nr:MAG: Galactose-1-phosphate uridylyltransferase [Candidatus Yanofskybacteria bacterium GW2011_GWA2_44_10]KKT50897.1 MAG: Galactose-1-phosphate uridylyltransferase [Candidatus Yanofskybacteria bacterium GW2011_GWA1_44_21]KKT90469.1 MAG: Galactose-1-phosphate uridylyltransferase [Candidatus Yanofskybacteria bacterium GW2011_GWB1_45_11]OGN03097.1 MAG: hypothetical protein A2657_01720 [Candidatus Yanofskybacteria bacterium RIFCSPHIGHO2_01_FULL_44_110b]OGN14276.1 MAG: hypothetical protein A3C01_01